VNCFAYFVRYLLGKFFLAVLHMGGYGMHHSLYTHTNCAYHEWAVYPGLCNLELEGIV